MMTILIIDDDKDLCEILSDFLRDEGYTVTAVCDGESALRELKNRPYDLLIGDYRLQEMNGLHLLEEVHQIAPSLIVIMISAFGSEEVRSRAKELGVYAFIEKPFDLEKMVAVIKQAFDRNQHEEDEVLWYLLNSDR